MPKKPLFIIGLENRLNNPTFPLAAAKVCSATLNSSPEDIGVVEGGLSRCPSTSGKSCDINSTWINVVIFLNQLCRDKC